MCLKIGQSMTKLQKDFLFTYICVCVWGVLQNKRRLMYHNMSVYVYISPRYRYWFKCHLGHNLYVYVVWHEKSTQANADSVIINLTCRWYTDELVDCKFVGNNRSYQTWILRYDIESCGLVLLFYLCILMWFYRGCTNVYLFIEERGMEIWV